MSRGDRNRAPRGLLLLAALLIAVAPARAAQVVNQETVRIGWAPASGPVSLYNVYVSRNGSAYARFSSVPYEVTSVAISGAPGDQFEILVRAAAADGREGPPSPVLSSLQFADQAPGSSDFDRDGRAEILWQSSSGLAIWDVASTGSWMDWWNGTVTVATQQSIAMPAPGSHVLAVADFDNDDRASLLVDDGSGGLSVGELGANGQVDTTAITQLAADEWVVGSGDYDGDGRADILIANDSQRSLTLWRMNGATILGVDDAGGFDPAAKLVMTGDWDGDRRSDLCWLRPDGLLEFWYMDGASHAAVTRSFSSAKWRPVAAGDFDGDGTDDLLFVHTRWGNFSVWSLAAGRNEPAGVTDVAAESIQGWVVVGTSDYDGNGRADILWRQDDKLKLSQIFEPTGVWITRDLDQAIGSEWQPSSIAGS